MKKILKNIFAIALYFFYDKIIYSYPQLTIKNFTSFEAPFGIIFLIAADVLFIGVLLLIYNKEIKNNIISFKNFLKNKFQVEEVFKYWFWAIFSMSLISIIIGLLVPSSQNNNEDLVRQLIDAAPLYMIWSTIIYAPIVEELIFREAFANLLKKKFLFLILSTLVFASIHVIGSADKATDYLQILPYVPLSLCLAFIRYKYQNININFLVHGFHNFLLISLQILGGLF